jgi:hypothetical protein
MHAHNEKWQTSDKTWGAASAPPEATVSTRTFFATGRADKAKASLAADARLSSSSEEYDAKFMSVSTRRVR